jgi:hypothetical protein
MKNELIPSLYPTGASIETTPVEGAIIICLDVVLLTADVPKYILDVLAGFGNTSNDTADVADAVNG